MLTVQYKAGPHLIISCEARDIQEVFKQLGPIQEVLGGNGVCGKCGGNVIRMVHRTTQEGHDIYELLCTSPVGEKNIPCNAKLALGTDQKTKNLFPRRYEQFKDESDGGKWKKKVDADGNTVWLPNNGWVRWDKKANDGKGGYV